MWYKNFMDAFEESGLSRHELADKANLPYDTVKRIVSGKTLNPTIDTLDRLSEALGKTLGDLLANTRTVVGDKTLEELQEHLTALATEHAKTVAERDIALAELTVQKDKVKTLAYEVEILNMKIAHKDELLAVHNFYNKLNQGK